MFFRAPCRVLEAGSASPAPRFVQGEQRAVQVGGNCGVPADAQAVFLALTVTNATAPGYLTVYEADVPQPLATAIDYPAVSTTTNMIAAALAGDGSGRLQVYAESEADIAIDVLGYAGGKGEPPPGVEAVGYQPLTGCRIADTRIEGDLLESYQDRTMAIQGRCNIPESAPLAMLNVTAISPGSVGVVKLRPSDERGYGPVGVGFSSGYTVVGSMLARLAQAPGGDVAFNNASGGDLHVTVDAQGYFGSNVPSAFRAVTPCRLFDTRQDRTAFQSGERRELSAEACLGAAIRTSKPIAAFVNLTVVAPDGAGQLAATLPGSSLPIITPLMTFSAADAARGHGGILQLDGSVSFVLQALTKGNSEVDVIADVYGYFETPTGAEGTGGGGSPLVLADGIHPANQRGVNLDTLYDFAGIDNVDLANGNLSVTLPIGKRYPVGGGLSYGLELSYNSKIWDYRLFKVNSGSSWVYYTEAVPNRISNAGLSWTLSLGGRLLSPDDMENNSGGPLINGQQEDPRPQWVWIDPQGGEHLFYHQLNATEDEPIAGKQWTRDGTYLRLVDNGPSFKRLEFPDGTVYVFELRQQLLFDGGGQYRWLLVSMVNQYPGNEVRIDYQRDGTGSSTVLKWLIDDSHERHQEVIFERDPLGINPAGWPRYVRLSASHGQVAQWELVYNSDSAIHRCHDTWYNNNDYALVTMLVAVRAPTSPQTSYAMTYDLSNEPPGVCRQGLLTRLAVPTAGNWLSSCYGAGHCAGMEWSYGDYAIPMAACDGRAHFSRTPGVIEKRLYQFFSGNELASRWTFQPGLAATADPPRSVICPGQDLPVPVTLERFHTFTNTVTTPLFDQTVHHFSVVPRPNYEWAPPTANPSRWQEFGLPLTRHAAISDADGKPLYLSEEIKDCPPAGPGPCTTVAKKYVRYERDASLFYESWPVTDRYDLQRRPAAERTVYLPGESNEHFVELRQADFDGAGHYRKLTEGGGGWDQAGVARTTETDYNAGNGTYELDDNGVPANQHTYDSLADRLLWKLDTYASSSRGQGASRAKEQACFDADTGFLERRRLFANGTSVDSRDVVVVYTGKDDQGNVKSETFYGGDRGGLSTSVDVCAADFPWPAAEYATRRDYTGGLPKSVEWMNGTEPVLRRYLAEIDIGGATVVSTTEPDEIRTDYHYDVLGRPEWIKPGNGQVGKFSAWTRFTYGTAAIGGCFPSARDTCASMLVERFEPGSFADAALLERHRYNYDGLGRLYLDAIRVPGETYWSQVLTSYDALGHVLFRSERHLEWNLVPGVTRFGEYDVFGRPRWIDRAGDNDAATFTYTGVKAETRTANLARFDQVFPTAPNQPLPGIVETPTTETTTFDAFHRTVRVAAGDSNDQLIADYGYDASDRLTSVRQTAPTGQPQARDFVYDGVGRLRGEDHPELRHAAGNATVCGGGARAHDVVYQSYDALGNLLRKCDDEVDLAYKYDSAQRLTEVRLAGETPNGSCSSELGTCLKKFVYGTGTGLGNRSNGKLVQASSFNYRHDTSPTGQTLFGVGEVVYDYSYDGNVAVDGGLSSRTLRLNASTNPSQAPLPGVERFTQGFSYTPLGAPAKVDYPTCSFAGCSGVPPARSISLGYTEGLLTRVSGYADLTYWQHPMLRRLTYSDGKIWQQDPDPSGLPRPWSLCSLAPGAHVSVSCDIVGSLGPYAYDGQGNVKAVANERYAYDAHGRLVFGMMDTGPYQRYVFDLFGNIQSKSKGIVGFSGGALRVSDITWVNLPTSAFTNQLDAASYDARGNLTSWAGNSYRYDELGRLGVVHEGAEARWHFYDVDGERVFSLEPSEFTSDNRPTFDWTLRGLDGKALRWLQSTVVNGSLAWTWKKDYVYRNGIALAYEVPAGRGVYFVDHLGTPRQVIAENNTASTHHYYPFGEEATFQPGDAEVVKFTGHERDLFNLNGPDDDVDYMHARYYKPVLGRFLSVDPSRRSASTRRPQSWNRYAYAYNNPLSYADPTGLWPTKRTMGIGGPVHQAAIDRALGKVATPAQRTILKNQQIVADQDQSLAGSYKHAMREPGQTAAEAAELATKYVQDQIRLAIAASEGGDDEQAMKHMGLAIHTLGDSTSPEHEGFQEWRGAKHFIDAAGHVLGENYDPGAGSELDRITLQAWQWYRDRRVPKRVFDTSKSTTKSR